MHFFFSIYTTPGFFGRVFVRCRLQPVYDYPSRRSSSEWEVASATYKSPRLAIWLVTRATSAARYRCPEPCNWPNTSEATQTCARHSVICEVRFSILRDMRHGGKVKGEIFFDCTSPNTYTEEGPGERRDFRLRFENKFYMFYVLHTRRFVIANGFYRWESPPLMGTFILYGQR